MRTTTLECDGVAGSRPVSAWLAVGALLAALVVLPVLRAQDAGQPARAVRLSYVDGKVTLSQDSQVVTDRAVANTPLLEGMTLATADDGRAEVQFEDGSVARLSPDSSFTLKVLRGQGASADTEIDLNKGLAYFELQSNNQGGAPIRLRFGDSVVTGSGFTIVRVENDTPPGQVAVFSGNAHLERSSGLALDIHGGESADLSASDPNGYNLAETIEPNSWDAWNSDRDTTLNAEASAQTGASAEVSGGQNNNPAWNDLDANGSWYNVPDQGYVWSPYDAANPGFDPYGNGNWVMTPGFGYTWASAYPWGYMPFQCGAWNYYNSFGWGWAPGIGGCTPWWGTGFYGGPYIGFAPGWYRPIHRPIGPPSPRPGRPVPVIAVNRHPMVLSSGLPARDRDTPVAINGRTVMSLRPMSVRSGYEGASYGVRSGYMAAPGMSAAPGVSATTGMRPGYVVARPAYAPPARGSAAYVGGQRTYSYAPASRGESQPVRSYSAPASHSSGSSSGGGMSGGGGYHGGGGGMSSGGGGGHSGGGGGGGGGHH